MPRLVPLPAELLGRSFSVAEARSAGITAGRLRSGDLERPFHGVRTPGHTSAQRHPHRVKESSLEPELIEQCRAYQTRMLPGQFFSHVTAARLWGAPLPTAFTPDEPLHVSSFRPRHAPRGRGVIGHQFAAGSAPLVMRFGLPVADAAASWVQLAGVLAEAEHVVVGDHLVLDPYLFNPSDPRPFTSIDQLAERLRDFRGRGKRAAQLALAQVRAGAESRPETLLRLLLTHAGLPEPLLNQVVRGSRGEFLGRVDMIYPQWRVIVEYDGDQHRTSTAQYERDSTRVDALRRAGFTVIRVRMRGLFVQPEATIVTVRNALHAAGWRA